VRPLPIVATLLAVATVAALTSGADGRSLKEGGTFRVGMAAGALDSIDAALQHVPGGAVIDQATCASLMRTPDQSYAQGAGVVPELAAGPPFISRDGKTYVFAIRRGLRFSTGASVTAADVAHTINRVLNKDFNSGIASALSDIVGAQKVLDGSATVASGIVARGLKLTIKLTRPVGDFTTRTTYLCVVPRALPADPEGAKPPIPTAAPYYVAEYVPNDHVVLLRNRYYRGTRPHHVDRFDIDLNGDGATFIDRADRGELDYAWAPNSDYAARAPDLVKKYGVNKSRFFTAPGTFLRMFVLNTSRPLFTDNISLRQAVNFAVDRHALLRERGVLAGRLTDQYLWPGILGFKDEKIYPLKAPNLKEARALARGHTRSGKAVAYVPSTPLGSAQGQILAFDLKKIGIAVEVKAFPPPLLFEKLATVGEPFDIGWIGWATGDRDPGGFLSNLFDGRLIGRPGSNNWSYFDSPRYNRLFDRAAKLTGAARYRTYGQLDADISRNAAPGIPFAYDNTMNLVSQRAGCVVLNPYLDLAAACLK
jgi:peptide/nickel transport system substrate-binding protein